MSSFLRSFLCLGDLVDRVPNPRNGYECRFTDTRDRRAMVPGVECER